jgi:outer membrane murein-binding lipoprotein Lpp|tara:strand:+ start:1447 stop:1698 length:252 start_codon:yes stop_codon:yes gene_type:complete
MVEVWAAVAGASVTVAGLGVSGLNRQSQQGRDSLVRLTTAVDNLSSRLQVLHDDIKTKDVEVFARLNELERSVARLEGHSDRH